MRFYQRTFFKLIFLFTSVLFNFNNLKAQSFPNPATLSTGQGTIGTIDPLWLASSWYAVIPPNPMGLPYIQTLINNNCAPGSWVDPAALPPPSNNGNWITANDGDCATNISTGYRYFRLPLNLPPDCNGFSVTQAGNYVLNLDGYVDNTIIDVFINGTSTGITGGSFALGGQLNVNLVGPWLAGINYVDILVQNGPNPTPGSVDPYGLLMVASSTSSLGSDTDNDGIPNLTDLCPCDPGTNPYGCTDPALFSCDVTAIRNAFTSAGCIEMPGCADDCSVYFLNPQSLSGTDAQAFAQTLGANLISVQSAAENQCIIDNLNAMGQGGVIWIGFNDESVEGVFEWYDQSPVTYTNWYPGEPNNSGDEDYVQLYVDGSWNDLAFGGSAVSVIEVNLCPLLTTTPAITICDGETANLTTTTLFGSFPYNYSWDNGGSGQSINVAPSTTTQYVVTTQDRYNCTTTDTTIVTVNMLPTVSFTANPVCNEFNTNFINTSTSINTVYWDFGDGTNSATNSPSHQYATAGTYTVKLIVTTIQGCVDSISQQVTVYPKPIANFNATNVCQGNATIFTNTSNVASGGITAWSWNSSNSEFSSLQNPSNTFPSFGNYPIELIVTTDNGCKDTISQPVTVYPGPTADFNAVNVCDQQVAQFTDNSQILGGGILTNWEWYFGDNTTSLLQNPTHLFPAENNYVNKLVVTSNNGCKDSITKNIEVWPLPLVNFTIPNVCNETVSIFTNSTTISSVNTANTIANWNWNFGDGATSALLNPTHNFTAEGIYTIKLIATSANGCLDSLSQNTTIYPKPVASFTATNVCLGAPTIFTNTSTVSTGAISVWSWNNANSEFSNLQNPSNTFPSFGNYPIELIITTDNGCKDTISQPVTVYPGPTADFNAVNVCDQQVAQFTDNTQILGGGIITNWDWYFGDNTTSLLQNPTHLFTSENSYSNKLVVTSDNGCKDSITKNIEVWPLPQVNFTIPNVCNETLSIFTNSTTISSVNTANTIANWNWQFGDGATSALLNPTHIYSTEGNFTIQLIATSANGCIDSLSQNTTIYPKPVASFTAANICEGVQTSFLENSTIGLPDNITNWDWTFGDNTTSTVQNPTHLFSSEQIYTNQLIVTTDNGCKDTLILNSIVWPLPIINFTVPNVCYEAASVFTNTSTISSLHTPNAVATWNWNYGDGTSSSLFSSSHSYASEGNYTVKLVALSGNGCSDSLSQNITINPTPLADFSVNNVCQGILSSFMDNSSISAPDNITDWKWVFGDNTSSTLQNPTHLFMNEQIYNNQLIVTSNNGCKDTFNLTNTVWPLPQVDFNVTEACLNSANIFTSNSSVSNLYTSNSISQWDYSFGDGSTDNTANTTHVYANDGVFNAQLILTTNNGCKDSIQHSVTVNPKPNATFNGINLSGCSPICPAVNSTSTINAPGTNASFSWVYSDGFTDAGTSTSRCFENTTGATQTYGLTLYVTSDKGCKDTATDPSYIQVYHLPIADFNFSPNDPSLINNTIQFDNLSSFADFYQWNFGELDNSNQFEPSYTFPFENNVYDIQLIVSTVDNCRDTIQKPIRIKDVVLIYVPNTFTPNGDEVNNNFKPIISAGIDPNNYSLFIFNRWGEMVFESKDYDYGWDGTYNGQPAQSGTYTWKIEYKVKDIDEKGERVGHLNLLR